MDLEEYRRIYMQAEGIGNTPANMFRRMAKLGKDISAAPNAARKDKRERAERRAGRREAMADMKKNGVSLEGIADYIANRPRVNNHTHKAFEDIADSATSAAMSINELGQTSAGIVGAKRNNLYEGQDLENGIRFALRARNALSKGLRLPEKSFHLAEGLVSTGLVVAMSRPMLVRGDKEVPFTKAINPFEKTEWKDVDHSTEER